MRETFGRDDRLRLKEGNLVEVVEDAAGLLTTPPIHVKPQELETFLVELDKSPTIGSDAKMNPVTGERPDQADNTFPLPPHGVARWYAPPAFVTIVAGVGVTVTPMLVI